MALDEEVFVMRDNKPITYIRFRRCNIYLSLDDVSSEKVELIDKGFIGYWIPGEDFLKILANLEEYVSHQENIDYLRNYFNENPVLPTDRVLYKLEAG